MATLDDFADRQVLSQKEAAGNHVSEIFERSLADVLSPYEHMDERMKFLTPVEFAYDYRTRTGRVSHAELKRRDPGLAEACEQLHPEVLGAG